MLRAIYPLLVSEKYIIFVLKLLDVYSLGVNLEAGKNCFLKAFMLYSSLVYGAV